MGAPLGNKNSSKENRLWAETIRRSALQDKGKRMRAAAEALLNKAAEGDVQAIKEFGDRMDGKPKQEIGAEVKGDLRVEIVRFSKAA